ncbi:hypothetical protein [Bradyrhizobium brasilense]|uniref:hypothetical protein n=1 Tax=Bradyrhizobium brasilense TaxID=1419277 RepID=UPI001E3BEEAF|nr:hypothetical protein [Bradyrhizobium brasilense]MCC8969155.1 hypothetical protein [Bradyrhizobium brasilense]
MSATIQNFIYGRLLPSGSNRTSPAYNPATEEQSDTLVLASKRDVQTRLPPLGRLSGLGKHYCAPPGVPVLNRFLRILEVRIDELAKVITAEHGKVLSDAKGDIQRGM